MKLTEQYPKNSEEAEILEQLNAAPVPTELLVIPNDPAEAGAILFGHLAAMWERDYVERVVGGKALVAASTKQKYRNHLHNHILPRWANTPIGQFRAKNLLDWLQEESGSWYMMTDLRNIMSGIFTKAQEWEVLPDTFANPITRVKLPKKWQVYERRILTEEQTVRVLAHMRDPHQLISELCLATGARISEVTGLQIKHLSLQNGWIRVEQRNWRGDIDSPKSERSKRTLTLGSLAGRLERWTNSLPDNSPGAWVFPQRNKRKPMWDSGPRAALKEAARAEKCDFPGFGLHSLRRANITWRQEVGGSSIEASRIAGHASTKMTEEYTVVQLNRQEELTRRIQEKLSDAANRINGQEVTATAPDLNHSSTGQNCLALNPVRSNECGGASHQHRREPMPTLIKEAAKRKRTQKPRRNTKPGLETRKLRVESKTAVILRLLQRRTGVTLKDLMAATGWQAHSVRGFISAGGKRRGLRVESSKRRDGQRVYQIR